MRYILALHAGIYLPTSSENLDRSKWIEVETPQPFDLAEMPGLYRVDGKTKIGRVHVGLFVSHKQLLHCEERTGTICIPLDRLRLPVLAIWRHETRR